MAPGPKLVSDLDQPCKFVQVGGFGQEGIASERIDLVDIAVQEG